MQHFRKKYLLAAFLVIGMAQISNSGSVSWTIDPNATYNYNSLGLPNVHDSKIWPIWSKIDIFNCTFVPNAASSIYDFVQEVCAPGGWDNARYYDWRDPTATIYQDDVYIGAPYPNNINTDHQFFKQIKKLVDAGIKPAIVFGYVPRLLSKNAGYITFPKNSSSGSATWKFYIPQSADKGDFVFNFRYLFNSLHSAWFYMTITGPTNFNPTLNTAGTWSEFIEFPPQPNWALQANSPLTALPSFPEGEYSLKLERASYFASPAGADFNIDYLSPVANKYSPHKYEAEYATITSPVILRNTISGFSCGREGQYGQNSITVDPRRYIDYQEYIRSLFDKLISDNGGPDKVRSWDFRFMEEPNHTHSWDPFAKDCDPIYSPASLQNDPDNLKEYMTLYDLALAGMDEAFVTDNSSTKKDLQIGPLTDVSTIGSWLPSLLESLSKNNRISGNDVCIAYDPYIQPSGPLGGDIVRFLKGQTDAVKTTFQNSQLKGKNLHLSLGEFCLSSDPNNDNAGMSNDGAAFFAAAFKTGLDLGYDFFNTWYWKTWGDETDASGYLWSGRKTAAYRLVDFLKLMNNTSRINASASKLGIVNADAELDILCSSKNSNKQLYVLVYNYNYLKPKNGDATYTSESYTLNFMHLLPNTTYRIEKNTISTAKNNFFPQWASDAYSNLNIVVTKYPYDMIASPMYLGIGTPLSVLWKSKRDGYIYEDAPEVSTIKTDATGNLIIPAFSAAPNTVYFFNIRIPDITPILNLLLGD